MTDLQDSFEKNIKAIESEDYKIEVCESCKTKDLCQKTISGEWCSCAAFDCNCGGWEEIDSWWCSRCTTFDDLGATKKAAFDKELDHFLYGT